MWSWENPCLNFNRCLNFGQLQRLADSDHWVTKKQSWLFEKKHKNWDDWGILNAGATQQKLSVPHETFQPKPFNSFEDGKKPHVLKASTKFQIHLKRAPRAWVKKACDFKSRTIPSRPLLGYHGLDISHKANRNVPFFQNFCNKNGIFSDTPGHLA